MKQLTILVDMDDTIECLLKGWVRWLNEKYNLSVNWKDIRSWDVRPYFNGLTKEQIYEPFYIDEFWDYVEPMPYAPEMLERIKNDGHKIYVVSASTYETLPAKMERVLFRYFPYFTFDDVIIAHDKQMIQGDILIDDAPHNLVNGKYIKLLMDAPHNQGFDEKKYGMRRVYDWGEIYDIILDISKGG